MNFLSKEYQAWLHWSSSLPALLSKRISKIIGKVKTILQLKSLEYSKLGFQSKKEKCSYKFLKIFLHASLISNSHILISQPLVGLGGG